MTGQSLTIVEAVPDLDAALVTVVRVVTRFGFVEPTVSIVPWLLPPDDSHVDPWPGFRVAVGGVVAVEPVVAPLAVSWPPPTGKAVEG